MSIYWRLVVLALQLLVLVLVTWLSTGKPFAPEAWYLAGLLAVIVNPQLWEPHYPTPGDVIGNGLIFGFFFGVAYFHGLPATTAWAWHTATIVFAVAAILAAVGLAGLKTEGGGKR